MPKRDVMAAAAGETIPTARTLGRSKTVGCCWVVKPSLQFSAVAHLSTAIAREDIYYHKVGGVAHTITYI
jgi:hypothetical protein